MFRSTVTACIIVSMLALPVITGCQTLPAGWEEVAPDRIGQASLILRDILTGKIQVDDEMKMCLASSGIVGGLNFWQTRESGDDVKSRILSAVNASKKHAEKYYPELCEKHGGFEGIVKYVITQSVIGDDHMWIYELTQSELLISLLHSVVNNNLFSSILRFERSEKLQLSINCYDCIVPCRNKIGV